jgi:hypothetical protein
LKRKTAFNSGCIPEFMMDSGIRLPSGRLCLSTVVFIGEERGMDFAVPLQPHEETVVILFRLINPADARRA